MTDKLPDPVREFFEEVAKDPFAKQALADAIESGAFPRTANGIELTPDGLAWMENREDELRREAN